MSPDERQKKLHAQIHEAMNRAEELERHITRQSKTDTFGIDIVFLTLGLCGLGALAVTVFTGG